MNWRGSGRWLPVAALLAVTPARGETPVTETRSVLEKWVETRQLISQTRRDWQADRDMLQQSVDLLSRELKSIAEQKSRLSTNSVQADRERLQAETSLKASNECLDKVRDFAAGFEARLRQFLPRLPVPLQDILKPLVNRLPADPGATRMPPAERLQVIVGILNELDKFNNAISIFNEKRRNEKGEEVAVETVYVGLGAAYFVNEAGGFAGSGSPGATGWEWSIRPELASSVREVIRIYRNERPASFVSLPAVIR